LWSARLRRTLCNPPLADAEENATLAGMNGAGTDSENLEHAQKLRGHATRDMTQHYARKRIGEKVSPVRRKL
jgi:hypothetical protein